MTVLVLLAHALLAAPQSSPVIVQVSTGWCSPNIANSVNITVNCIGVSPEAVAQLNAELKSMHLQRDEYLERANAWAERYHELERSLKATGYDPALSRRATTYLKQGNLDKAEAILKEKTQKERKTNLESAEDNYNLGLVELLKFQPKEALPYLEQAYGIDKRNLKYAEQYASALLDQNDVDNAGPVLRSALTRAQAVPATDPAYSLDVVKLQNLLGLLYSRIPERWDASESAYKDALQILRPLAASNPSYQPRLAATLVNLGNLQRHRKNWAEAAESYQEAVQVSRELIDKAPGVYSPLVAKLDADMGNLYSDLHLQTESGEEHLNKAEDLYTSAIEIFTQLADHNPAAYLPDKAQALNNLGSLYQNNPTWRKYPKFERWNKGIDCYNRALEIRRKLAENNPDAFFSALAQTLSSRAALYAQAQKWPLAEPDYNEALKIRDGLAKNNPDAFNQDLALTLVGLAAVYRNTDRHKEAADKLEEASGIYRKLASANPAVYQLDSAGTTNNLAIEHWEMHNTAKAQTEMEEALSLFRHLAKNNQAEYGDRLARSLLVYAKILESAGQERAAVCPFLKEAGTAAQSEGLKELISRQPECK